MGNSADDKLFVQKTSFGISCKLSPKETVCMKYQSDGKISEIYFKMSSAEIISQLAKHYGLKMHCLYDDDSN